MLCGEVAQAYDVADETAELSVMELADILFRRFPEKALRVERCVTVNPAASVGIAVNRIEPDTTRLQALGWNAEVIPAEGFKRMIEAPACGGSR